MSYKEGEKNEREMIEEEKEREREKEE